MTKETGTKRPHHHGNLREALIVAGLDLMEQGGADSLTLRKCAKRAGVSHAAPAHHFNGMISLQAAIVARGHRLFSQAMQQASAEAKAAGGDTPYDHLLAICNGYISFARAHTAVFKFMFRPHDIDVEKLDALTREELLRDSVASYQILREACAPFEHSPPADASGTDAATSASTNASTGTEIMVWSLVHGYAMLFCGPAKTPTPPHSIPDFSQILPKLELQNRS